MTYNRKTVFVAMSGGVDSSVAAFLLKKQGYKVIGVFMRCFNLDGCVERDAEDARRVAQKLEIPFYVWDFEKEYKKEVVEYMINGYKKGITPNPDVMCNKKIKFGLFLKKALAMGADYMATGHYVKLVTSNQEIVTRRNKKNLVTSYQLLVAHDLNKDQSYFLWTLTQKQLKHCLFPIGNYLKSEVRIMARKAGLPTAEKKDSQGICFLGKISLNDFLSRYIPPKKGEVLTVNGEKIGEHHGVHFYTIGQRHFNILNFKPPKTTAIKNRQPYYIVRKDIKRNVLIVAEGKNNPVLYQKEIKLEKVDFINPLKISNNKIPVLARVRYRQPLKSAYLSKENRCLRSYKLVFLKPQKFIAPGQSAVFYLPAVASAKAGAELELLGGGVII